MEEFSASHRLEDANELAAIKARRQMNNFGTGALPALVGTAALPQAKIWSVPVAAVSGLANVWWQELMHGDKIRQDNVALNHALEETNTKLDGIAANIAEQSRVNADMDMRIRRTMDMVDRSERAKANKEKYNILKFFQKKST